MVVIVVIDFVEVVPLVFFGGPPADGGLLYLAEDVDGDVITVGDADEEGVLSVVRLFEDWRCSFNTCDAVVELVLAPDAC